MGAFSEMEASLIRERVIAGLEAAKENGKILGRPPHTKQVSKALHLYTTTNLSVYEIARHCQLSPSTIYKHIKKSNSYRNVS